MSGDPSYDAEVEAARAAAQRPDSAAADQEAGGADLSDTGGGTSGATGATEDDYVGDGVNPTPDMGAVHEANAEGVNPEA